MKFSDPRLFKLLREFFKVHLPMRQHCSEHTIRAYRDTMNKFVDFVKARKGVRLEEVTFDMLSRDELVAYLDHLVRDLGNSLTTRNQRLHCIRAFFSYAAAADVTLASYLDKLSSVCDSRQSERMAVEYMSESAMSAMLSSPDASVRRGLRDKAMMILMYDIAARVGEIVGLKIKDIRFESPAVVSLLGKGKKERVVPISEKAVRHIKRYVELYHDGREGNPDSPLFYASYSSSKHPMTTDNVRRMILKYAKIAHKKNKEVPEHVHPHMFRHSRAMHLYQSGMSLPLISQFLGHSHIETTMIYAYADTEMKRQAIVETEKKRTHETGGNGIRLCKVDNEEDLKKLYGLKC